MSIWKQTWTFILPQHTLDMDAHFSLPKEEHNYLFRVLRLSEGDHVEVVNGEGIKAQCKIIKLDRKESILQINKRFKEILSKTRVHIVLGQLKSNALEEAVSLASEIGISDVHIFRSEHTQLKQTIKTEKLQKIAYEALRISKSAYVSKVSEYDNLQSCIDALINKSKNAQFIVCDQESKLPIVDLKAQKNVDDVFVLVGPEANFSPNEMILITNLPNYTTVSLGSHVLRASTAVACAGFTVLNIQKS